MRMLTATLASLVALGAAGDRRRPYRGSLLRRREGLGARPRMMAMPVPVAPVVKKTLPIYLDYSARLESIRSIALQAKVSGYHRVPSPSPDGSDVKSGDLLYRIDPRDLQAALDRPRRRRSATPPRSTTPGPISSGARSW